MPIDFSLLVSKKEVIVPVLQKYFQYHRKKYSIEAEDGWWVVEIQNNRTIAKEPYFWATINSKYNCATGYSYGNQIVFNNFDVAHRLWGANLITPLHFNSVDTFSAIN